MELLALAETLFGAVCGPFELVRAHYANMAVAPCSQHPISGLCAGAPALKGHWGSGQSDWRRSSVRCILAVSTGANAATNVAVRWFESR